MHAISKNHIPIRLTNERWAHISEEHSELINRYTDVLQTVADADRVLAGSMGELLAIKKVEPGKWLVVVYRENISDEDGFVFTAFLTRRVRSLERRNQLWP
jgi:hypothetical protein